MSKTPLTDAHQLTFAGVDGMVRYAVHADFARKLETDRAELVELVNAFVAEQVDYMTRNLLGDPEQQHNVKWARALLARLEADK